MTERVLLLWTTTSYRGEDFLAAAARLGVEVVVGTDRCHQLAELWPEGALALDFRNPGRAVEQIVEVARQAPLRAVVPTDDHTSVIASAASAALGLPGNPPHAARATEDKGLLRARLSGGGVPQPAWLVAPLDADPAQLEPPLPCVVKPLCLSASRGVIRADDPAGFAAAFARVRRLLEQPEIAARGDAARLVLVEAFVPGPEVALEGLVDGGELRVLALFDKPDPLDGPYFEETLYVTPSRLPAATQAEIARVTAAAVRALGFRHGPVHAELRLPPGAPPAVIEVAARSIGGLCSRTLRFGAGVALEDVILAHALGRDPLPPERERGAAGVLMLPIPRRGVLREVRGLERALAVPGVAGVEITAPIGQELIPLPEGSSYLGFAFARGDSPEAVERALRAAHAALELDLAVTL